MNMPNFKFLNYLNIPWLQKMTSKSELEFYGSFKTVNVMLSWSVNFLTFFVGWPSSLSVN